MEQEEIDTMYLREAYKLAMQSPDPSTQNGAIIVRQNNLFSVNKENVIGVGFNCFPKRFAVTSKRMERPQKYSYIEHAERNAVFNAAELGKSPKGGIMYVPWFACADCGRAIIQVGIKEVIGSTFPEKWWKETRTEEDGAKNWYDSRGHAIEMFDESGIVCRWVDGPIDKNIEILFDGKKRNPF